MNRGFTLVELIVFIVAIPIAMMALMVGIQGTADRGVSPLFTMRTNELAKVYLEEILTQGFDEKDTEENACADKYRGFLTGTTPVGCTPTSGFGPDTGEAGRADYDDVDDYHLLVEGEASACTNFAGMGDLYGASGPFTPSSPYLLDANGDERGELDVDGNPVVYFGYCVEVVVNYDGDYDGAAEPVKDPSEADYSEDPELRAKRIQVRVTHGSSHPVTLTAYRAGF